MPLRRVQPGWLQWEPLLAVLLWGGIYPGAKLALRDMPALSFTSLRLVLATALLFVVAARVRSPRLPRRLWRPVLWAGLAQLAFQGLLVAGLNRTSAGNSAILLATAPLLTAAWLGAVGRERLTLRRWCGLALGLVGVVLLVQGSDVGISRTHLAGDLLALAAAGAWAWYGFAIGPPAAELGGLLATAWAMAVATAFFLPLSLGEALRFPWGSVAWASWAGFTYSATAGMVVAMSLWGRSMHRLGPRQTMVYAYFEPLSAVVIAAIVLGERFGALQVAGMLTTFAGVWLALQRRTDQTREATLPSGSAPA